MLEKAVLIAFPFGPIAKKIAKSLSVPQVFTLGCLDCQGCLSLKRYSYYLDYVICSMPIVFTKKYKRLR